jgi:DNA invertase Pin-like site-specific DNA recombinase
MQKDTTQIKYIAYSRKSTESEDRQVLSLNDQKREIEETEKKENLKVVMKFLGDGKGESHTAHKRGRPIFNKVMDLIEAGKANGLLVWHANRLARNALDGGRIITAMDEGSLLEVKTTSGRTYYNTPEDKFFLQLEFGMAKKSSDDNSVAVKRGLKTKLNLGWKPSRAPLGYLNSKNFEEKGQNYIFKDNERFDIVRRMWNLMLTGNYTPPQILEIVNSEWKFKTRTTKRSVGKPLARSSIYRIFTNPFYYGYFNYGGQLYKGNHEPMITEKEFDQVQKLLGRDGRPRPKEHRFAFTGLMKCGNCGAMITAEEKIKRQKNGNIHHYVYYHCTKRIDKSCPEKMIELKDLDVKIDLLIKDLTISDKFKGWAIRYLHEIRQNEAQSNKNVFENKQKSLLRITDQLQNLILKYTAPENSNEEIMTSQEMQGVKASLLKQKTALESDLKAQGKTIEEWAELSERTFNFARYAQMWFANGDIQTKRAVFSALGSHLIIKDQNLNVALHPYFKIVFDNLKKAERELIKVRTSEFEQNRGQIALILAKCPTLRRRWDSNHLGLSDTLLSCLLIFIYLIIKMENRHIAHTPSLNA